MRIEFLPLTEETQALLVRQHGFLDASVVAEEKSLVNSDCLLVWLLGWLAGQLPGLAGLVTNLFGLLGSLASWMTGRLGWVGASVSRDVLFCS